MHFCGGGLQFDSVSSRLSSSRTSGVQAPVCGSFGAADNNESMQLSTDDTPCAHCNDVTGDPCSKGDICDDVYHGHCTALPQDVVSVLLTIVFQCVRLSRLLVGFRTHFKSLRALRGQRLHSFIQFGWI